MSKEQDLQLIDMVKSTNPLYNKYFRQVKWLDSLVVTNSDSESSYRFLELDEDKELTKNVKDIPLNIINRVFNIKIDDSLYHQAISGDGQEYRRITTLHSSSLAALLFFHSVSKAKPICIEGHEFNEVRFEQKTTVQDSHKSNMDVVLLNKEKKIVMFLECKFSEYLNSGKYSHISPIYYDTYQALGLFDGLGYMKAQNMPNNDQGEIELIQSKNYQYCAGIKQIVSHYMGIRNFNEGGYKDIELGFVPEKILLAEILFALPETVDTKNRRGKYEEAYKLLAERINKNAESLDNFEILPTSLTYQDVFCGYDLPKRIKEFYSL